MPAELLLTFYGDDFTGSTDAMEALARSGLRTILFLRPPAPADLDRFPGVRAVGLAGVSRSMAPEQMDVALPPAFAALQALGAPIIHYKVCSTFDSAPEIGSIGRAIEIGRRQTGSGPVPVIVGAPALGRYCVFGNLFARSGAAGDPYRLDRHPTMRQHPVTPMDESDLRRHLARQTALPCALLDVLDLADESRAAARYAARTADGPAILLCDTLTDQHLAILGGLIERAARLAPPLFVVGSSGVEYALAAHWLATGAAAAGAPPVAPPVAEIVAVSGSCSPVTAAQIAQARADGFAVFRLQPDAWRDDEPPDDIVGRALDSLSRGQSVLVHTCEGPDDLQRAPLPGIADERSVHAAAARRAGPKIGAALGRILRSILSLSTVRRVAVAGGDTAGDVVSALGLDALEMLAPLATGSPLCRAVAPGSRFDGLELILKGGQVGRASFFEDVRTGAAT